MAYFFYGPDFFRLRQRVLALHNDSRLTYTALDLSSLDDARSFLSLISSGSLFPLNIFVHAHNLFGADPSIRGVIQKKLDDGDFHFSCVLTHTAGKEICKKADKKFFDFLLKTKNIQPEEFLYLEKIALGLFAKDCLKSHGRTASQQVIQSVIAASQMQDPKTRKSFTDSGYLAHALERCALYAKSMGRTAIGLDDVELLIPAVPTSVFACTDAVLSGNMKTAVPLVKCYIEEQDGAEGLFYLLSSQIKNLFIIRSMLEAKNPIIEIGEKLGIHPYVFQKSLAVAQRYAEPQLRSQYLRLLDYDAGIRSGRINHEQALWSLVYSL